RNLGVSQIHPVPTPGLVPEAQVRQERELEAAGIRFIQSELNPAAEKIAQAYGAKQSEVLNAILWYIDREPAQFLTKEKIDSIVNYDVPMLFEQNGYNKQGTETNTGSGTNDLDAIKQQLAALQATVAW